MKANKYGEYEVSLTATAGTDPVLYVSKAGSRIDLSTGNQHQSHGTWFASMTEEKALRLIFILRLLTKDARAARKAAKTKAAV